MPESRDQLPTDFKRVLAQQEKAKILRMDGVLVTEDNCPGISALRDAVANATWEDLEEIKPENR